MSDDMVTWLRQQLDEDERLAQGALAAKETGIPVSLDEEDRMVIGDRAVNAHATAHIIRHGPARVLAEVAAKRAILDLEQGQYLVRADIGGNFAYYSSRDTDTEVRVTINGHDQWMSWADFHDRYCEPEAPSQTVRLLALPYADRPGYRDEWRAAVEPA